MRTEKKSNWEDFFYVMLVKTIQSSLAFKGKFIYLNRDLKRVLAFDAEGGRYVT